MRGYEIAREKQTLGDKRWTAAGKLNLRRHIGKKLLRQKIFLKIYYSAVNGFMFLNSFFSLFI